MNKTQYEAALLEFLTDWLAWAEMDKTESRSPQGVLYSQYVGLCANSHAHPAFSAFGKFCNEPILKEWSSEPGDGAYWPFGMSSYDVRSSQGTQHKCPARLAWVRNRIKELEGEVIRGSEGPDQE